MELLSLQIEGTITDIYISFAIYFIGFVQAVVTLQRFGLAIYSEGFIYKYIW